MKDPSNTRYCSDYTRKLFTLSSNPLLTQISARKQVLLFCFCANSEVPIHEGLPGGGGGGGPCSLVPFQNCPMFPCSHILSECFCTVIFRILFPCSQKLANVPFDILPMFPCSPKPLGDPHACVWIWTSYRREMCRVRGGVLKQVLYGEAPPRDLTPYPFIYHFFRKGTPFVYLLLEKGTPFHIPSYE